jgi:hypothetical protein
MVTELGWRQDINFAKANLEGFHLLLPEVLHLTMASGVLTVYGQYSPNSLSPPTL